uniref:Putative secreted protein n=1 Tax=Ixodes ricinus TaxID=34613 RepID=A0A6B0UAE6_IXORI
MFFLRHGIVFILHWLICFSLCPDRNSFEIRLLIYLLSENDICMIMYGRTRGRIWMNEWIWLSFFNRAVVCAT